MIALMGGQTPRILGSLLISAGLLAGCGTDVSTALETGETAGAGAGAGTSAAGSNGTAGHNSGGVDQGGGNAGDAGSADNAGTAGDAGSADNAGTAGDAGKTDPALDLRGVYVKKARPGGDGTLLLLDKPLALSVDNGSPQRELVHERASRGARRIASSTATRFLIDFTRHPSGELTLLFSTSAGYELERRTEEGELLSRRALDDEQIDADPPTLTGPPSSPMEPLTRDAGRLEAAAEDAIVAARSGRHSVIAYRFDRELARTWRTLVVPAYPLYGIGLTSGSYDTFGQLACHTSVHLAVDDDGRVYVAVQHPHSGEDSLLQAYEQVFGETLVGDPMGLDIYVTRLDAAGQRLGTSVVGTPEQDELYGLRAAPSSAIAMGRTNYPNATGTGFDALLARVDGSTGSVELRELDVERGDLAFDAAVLSDDSWLVAGVSGYDQNPNGASISEASVAFVR
ncbi:MAG TPA: hypothetical protein VGJ91_05665, partial [Polyangiaceae bacterium]